MSNFLKKAMGLFVEFEPDETHETGRHDQSALPGKFPPSNVNTPDANPPKALSAAEMDKFEQHFNALFERSNFPGPDYYEFWKMMDALEAHVKDESARMSAVFATLSIQGLTKNKLIETAAQYKQIIAQDRSNFEAAVNEKASSEIDGRQQQLAALQKKMANNAALIQQLTKEITDAQNESEQLKEQIAAQEQRIVANRQGYQVACEAMIRKINTDIQKIETAL
ncbi:hypothetical protein [Chitinophaga vietnamensis]|uniref:hypothetical protein n=1 Tax=Chitinophaga vietnamensis TaxID=2593957 RepID=UPI001177FD37|nr:hypothetical protein [Chitinophaga vietnamensis]